jgi:hypothetical protein
MCSMSTALRLVKEPSNLVNYGLLAKVLGLSSVLRAAWCGAPLEMNDGTPLG